MGGQCYSSGSSLNRRTEMRPHSLGLRRRQGNLVPLKTLRTAWDIAKRRRLLQLLLHLCRGMAKLDCLYLDGIKFDFGAPRPSSLLAFSWPRLDGAIFVALAAGFFLVVFFAIMSSVAGFGERLNIAPLCDGSIAGRGRRLIRRPCAAEGQLPHISMLRSFYGDGPDILPVRRNSWTMHLPKETPVCSMPTSARNAVPSAPGEEGQSPRQDSSRLGDVADLGGCPFWGRARQKKYGVKPDEPLPRGDSPWYTSSSLSCGQKRPSRHAGRSRRGGRGGSSLAHRHGHRSAILRRQHSGQEWEPSSSSRASAATCRKCSIGSFHHREYGHDTTSGTTATGIRISRRPRWAPR